MRTPPALPTGTWIKKPDTEEAAHSTHHRAVSSGLTGSARAPNVIVPMETTTFLVEGYAPNMGARDLAELAERLRYRAAALSRDGG